ncbi:unnamed protein product, partial [Choristocarpus tenellus]
LRKVDPDGRGQVYGQEAARLLGKSGLTRSQLAQVWEMADQNRDGMLNSQEWAIALHIIR